MDIHAYIQSGIIETYVLGLTSAEESAEVDNLRLQYVEVDEAINEFSLMIEDRAFENAVAPPPDIKSKIIASIKNDFSAVKSTNAEIHVADPGVVPISSMRNWRMLAAASIILFAVSGAFNYHLYNKYTDRNKAYQALLSERETLQANVGVYQTQLREWQSAAAMMADTMMTTVKMRSANGKDNAATVFWNTQNKDVYVMVNKLPEPVSGKQYQLWAMVDGKPVDAGVLNPTCSSVCKMKNIPRAQAFAITLEKEGGSPVPNLKALFVMGAI